MAVLAATPFSAARAFDNDLALWKLGSPDNLGSGDHAIKADPLAQERFSRFVGELAMAFAPQPAAPANSLGDAGFELSLSTDLAFIHPSQRFSTGQTSGVWPLEISPTDLSQSPSSGVLFLPTLHFRKGLPFSFEAGVDVTYLTSSHMTGLTAMLKWGIVEGFDWWPDVAVRGFATMLLGTGPLNLVVSGWDVAGGYRFPLGGSWEATLYGGFQMLGANATTANIDFDPGREDDREPTADDTVFKEMSLESPLSPSTAFARPYFGLRVRTGVLVLGVDASQAWGQNPIGFDPPKEPGDPKTKLRPTIETGLWKVAANLGVQF